MSSTDLEITALPVFSAGAFRFLRRQLGSILDLPNAAFTYSGAVALRVALKAECIGQGDDVLVPAYHCKAMVAPIVAVGAQPIFFGITEELACDYESIERAVTKQTRAMLVPHFFGRIQDLKSIAAFCAANGIILIEDCAHAIVGSRSTPVGRSGDYLIASPRKFAPVPEGGFIASMRRPLPTLISQAYSRNVRVAYDVLDIAFQAGRISWLAPLVRGPAELLKRSKPVRAAHAYIDARPQDDDPLEVALRSLVDADAACAVSTLLFEHWDYEGAANKRRHNYTLLQDHILSIGGKIVDSSLELSQAPYMMPLLLTKHRSRFSKLRESGLPAWRWESSVRGVCRITDHYAQSLAQIPCHQSLNEHLIQRICAILEEVL